MSTAPPPAMRRAMGVVPWQLLKTEMPPPATRSRQHLSLTDVFIVESEYTGRAVCDTPFSRHASLFEAPAVDELDSSDHSPSLSLLAWPAIPVRVKAPKRRCLAMRAFGSSVIRLDPSSQPDPTAVTRTALTTPGGTITAIAEDYPWCFAASVSGLIVAARVLNDTVRALRPDEYQHLYGHLAPVTHMESNPGWKQLVSVDTDKIMYSWDLKRMMAHVETTVLQQQFDTITALAIEPKT